MTEPNKELPKEVQTAVNLYSGCEYVGNQAIKLTAQFCQSHYAPIIEGKDKEIAALEKIRDFHIKENNGKDKRIAELEAEVKKVMRMLPTTRR